MLGPVRMMICYKENKRKATRRKANTGSVWATGEEAGIVNKGEQPKAEEPKNDKASEDKDDDGPDDILNMFGD